MGKIKHTKNELKTQRDALRRFKRYLPTLLLKKQQLQMEIRRLEREIREKSADEKKMYDDLLPWIRLFSEPVEWEDLVRLDSVRTRKGNVAGVSIPLLEKVTFRRNVPDLFAGPAWIDAGIEALEGLVRLRAERLVLGRQHEFLMEELRSTTQRVNLFEKVKIPECTENIRIIRIFLGDQQTAAVARSKIAKSKGTSKVNAS